MTNYFYVFIGGGLGACLRYAIGLAYQSQHIINIPIKSLLANLLGSMLAAIAFAIYKHFGDNAILQALVIIGFCGGLTTFSSYILEAQNFLETKNFIGLLIYVLLHNILGLCLFLVCYQTATRMLEASFGR